MRQSILKDLLLALSVTIAQATSAYSFKVNGINYTKTSATEVEVAIYDYDAKYNGNFVIPQKIEVDGKEYTVTGIGKRAFLSCAQLESISIPQSVKTIGSSAFNECAALTNIIIPNSVTYIDESAFANCTGLTSIQLPDSLKTIRRLTFQFTTWPCPERNGK